MVADASYYASVLESLYGELADRDVTGYEWAASDGWTQARFVDAIRGGSSHLETWIDLSGGTRFKRSFVEHDSGLTFWSRYAADDDSIAQARTLAATRDAMEMLARWSHPSGARTLPTESTIAAFTGEWIEVRISFVLQIPRGRD